MNEKQNRILSLLRDVMQVCKKHNAEIINMDQYGMGILFDDSTFDTRRGLSEIPEGMYTISERGVEFVDTPPDWLNELKEKCKTKP